MTPQRRALYRRIDADGDDADLVLLEPETLDAAIVGVIDTFEPTGYVRRVVYDRAKVLAIFAKDMGREGAEEYFEYNTAGAYLGPRTPAFLTVTTRARR